MTLVAGLGNPTDRYKNNRHNIGFMTVDQMIDSLKPSRISKSQFVGELYKAGDLLLLKPLTFMNLSGQSVKAVKDYYKVDRVIVIHDDLDLVFGSIRFKHGGGSGGHNGLKSIDSYIGNGYDRIRLGIGKPKNKEDVVKYVLSDFSQTQKECLELILKRASDAAKELAKSTIEQVASIYSSKKSLCD